MATNAITLPRARRRPRNQPTAGRANFPEVYVLKKIDNSRLRREVDLRKRRECFRLLGPAVLIFLFLLLFAWQHFQCIRIGYQIEQLKVERESLEQWNHQLRLEQASLADPQRIDALAREKLGFTFPRADQVIQVGPSDARRPAVESPEFARNFSPSRGNYPREQ
jgi:cell division protein FtsL